MCVHVCVSNMCVSRRLTSGVFFNCSPLYFFFEAVKPEAQQFYKTGYPVSPKDTSVPASSVL